MPFLTYTTSRDLYSTITSNSTGENKALGDILINTKLGEIQSQRDWYFLYASDTTRSTVASQQNYDLPGDLGKLLSATVQFNTEVYSPKKSPTRQHWDRLNQSSSPTSDSPEWFYPFAGEVGFYPKFSSANGSITYNYKKKEVELSISDFTGTVESATNGSKTIVTGVADLTSAMAGLWIKLDKGTTATSGDGRWYQINLVQTSSQIVLNRPYGGDSFTAALALNYTIGQASLLPENFHQVPVYGAAEVYYTSIKPDQNMATMYKGLYAQGILQLQREHGQVTSDVRIEDGDGEAFENPNFYIVK
jgi:hypothetical protein